MHPSCAYATQVMLLSSMMTTTADQLVHKALARQIFYVSKGSDGFAAVEGPGGQI